jgi:hypothetical protein
MKSFNTLQNMKTLLLVPACLFAALSYGQVSFNFQVGTEYELPRKTEDLAFVGNEKDGIINLSLKKEELNIVRFNTSTLKKTMEQRIDLDATRNFNSEIVTDFDNGGQYYWIHSDWDKGSGTEMLLYDKIDVSSGKITESNKKMIETTKLSGIPSATGFYSFKIDGKYRFDYDADRKKLLVAYRLVPESRNDKKNYDKIGFHVFDEKMNKLWGGEYTMPYTEAVMDNSDFSVDAKGNAYLLAKVYEDEKRRERDKSTGKPGYHYEVLKFTKESKQPIIAKISMDEFYINETTLIENPLHDMVIACTYSKKTSGTGTDGIFLATLDQNGKLTKYKNGYYEFPKEELAKFESARSRRKIAKNDDYEAANLKVRNVLVEGDGGIFITCEEYYMVTHYSTTGNGYTRTYYTYHYNDMLGARIDATGKFQWMRKIPKQQRGTNGRGTMSFKLVADANGYHFLYLDNLKNLNLPEDEVPRAHVDGYGGMVIVATINKDGEVRKELLFDTRKEDMMIFPADFYRINNNQFIGRARLKRNLYLPLLITSK